MTGRTDPRTAAYASTSDTSRGRRFEEPGDSQRTLYQRDRDRIVHCNAFRRLMYKTQVFVNHEGDHYRTRLTHSLEVSQIGRSVALALRLNETLTEAICLAHDLGHTPFGHAGQDALNQCMSEFGGFEHNLQSLRIVDTLEEKYALFDGLNLTFESREGILKHCSRRNARNLGEIGQRFLERTQPAGEAQLADIVDAIAYNHHDVEDGLRAGLLDMDALRTQALFDEPYREVTHRYPKLSRRRLIHEVKRRMISFVVSDLIAESQQRINALGPDHPDAIRAATDRVIAFSKATGTAHVALKKFLMAHMYRHPQVTRMQAQAAEVVTELFDYFASDIGRIPQEYRERRGLGDAASQDEQMRLVADYLAGMTDRFALSRHAEIKSASRPVAGLK